jgi:FtsP/CotA-like multicopper oxidase with cupredoxin domain
LRDKKQRHDYKLGEFAPGGLYHNTVGVAGFDGTTAGIPIKFHPDMPKQEPTSIFTFDGTLPPKLLQVRYGEATLMRHYNALPIDPSANNGFGLHTISTHEHNGHTPAESDGYTNAFFFPGQFYDYRWPIQLAGYDTINTDASDPRAGRPDGNGGITNIRGDYRETMSTHWFHDHMLDFTAQNVYKGNATMMNYHSSIDRGNEAIDDGVNLRFPSGTALDWGNRDYDVNLVIADKAWDANGQLFFNIFNTGGFLGDQMLTNWLHKPTFDVRARRYRFRMLNGAVSRYIKVALVTEADEPVPFHMILNDGNIMQHAVAFPDGILPTQSIAERYDIIVDFSQYAPGTKIYMVNLMEHKNGKRPEKDAVPLADVLSGAYKPTIENGEWKGGDPVVGKFLEMVVVAYGGTDLSMDPADFVAGKQTMIELPPFSDEELANAKHRTFEFGRSSGTDGKPWTIKTDGGSGLGMEPRRLSAAPTVNGDAEIWHIENGGGGWSHPIHIHFEEGKVLSRDGKAPPEWEVFARKDVYRIGKEVDSSQTIDVALRFREFGGTYVEHCHNTQHEDTAMLLRWDIENPGQMVLLPTPLPTWDGVSYVDSHALSTFRTGSKDASFTAVDENITAVKDKGRKDKGRKDKGRKDKGRNGRR